MSERAIPSIHGMDHLPGGPDPIPFAYAVHEIKVVEDINAVVVGDDAWRWEIPIDLDDAEIVAVAGFVVEAGAGDTEIDLRLGPPGGSGADILDSKIIIESGEYSSKTAAVQPVVTPDTIASWGDFLHVDVDAAGAVLGLGIHVFYLPRSVASLIVQGAKGDPGGVTQWTGAHDSGTTYTTGQAVSSGGSSYVAIQDSTGVVPGVTPGWEAYWMPLVVGHEPYGGFDVVINGNGGVLDTGIKAYVPIPYDGDIVEATLLADVAGSVVVDIWSDTYGSFPPTNADSITSATPLTLSSSNKTTDTSLSGWTTALVAGDVLAVVVESVSLITLLTVGLRVQRP